MRLKLISLVFGSAIALSSVGAAFAAPAQKIYICHATGSPHNPLRLLAQVAHVAEDAHVAHGDRLATTIEVTRGDCGPRVR